MTIFSSFKFFEKRHCAFFIFIFYETKFSLHMYWLLQRLFGTLAQNCEKSWNTEIEPGKSNN